MKRIFQDELLHMSINEKLDLMKEIKDDTKTIYGVIKLNDLFVKGFIYDFELKKNENLIVSFSVAFDGMAFDENSKEIQITKFSYIEIN